MNKSAALIIGYARNKEILRQIEVLHERKVKIYLSLDGPKTREISAIQEKLIDEIQWDRKQSVHVRRSPINYGVACGVISSIDWFFSEVDQGLILEDDLILEESAVDFVEAGLNYIKNIPYALMVAASTFSREINTELRVSWTHIPLIWGWGTTQEKWKILKSLIIEPVKLDFSGLKNPSIGYFQAASIAAQSRKTDTWDSPLALKMLQKSFICLVPPVNLVSNVGVDRFAEHVNEDSFPLFNPVNKMKIEEVRFTEPDTVEVLAYDKKLFEEVFRVKQRHRLSGIFRSIESRISSVGKLPELVRVLCNEGDSRITLVLVHLGTRIPQVLIKNLLHLLRANVFKIVLITDVEVSKRIRSKLPEVTFIHPKQFLEGWVNEIHSDYRSGFWDKSKARIFVLLNFCLLQSSKRIMHIENDVWLSPRVDFNAFFTPRKVSFTRVSPNQASGAVMFIGDSSELAITSLRELLIEQATKTDMETLADFANHIPEFFEELVSRPNGRKDSVIFDPAMIGMHLFGEDPRNRFGKARIFSPYTSHGFNLNNWKFNLAGESLKLTDENLNSYEVASLHVHSKNVRVFKENWRSVIEKQLLKRSENPGEAEVFSGKGLILGVFDYAKLVPSYFKKQFTKRVFFWGKNVPK